MKHLHRLPAVLLAITLATSASAHAQLTINYDYTGAAVPDNGQLSQTKILGGLSGLEGNYTNVVARLNLTSTSVNNPMYLGDLYSSLTFGQSGESQRIAVLLNRPGVNNTNAFGSSLSSLNVTLDDSSAATNIFATTSSTGTYNADGRLSVNPQSSTPVDFASGSNGLAALNGAGLASNRVSLLVGDYSQGGTATLSSWGVSVTGTAASTGSFTPGANASISDGSGTTNTLGAALDTTGSTATGLVVNLAGTTTVTGVVSGSGGIQKTGVGTLKYTAANTYTGTTTVTAGTLLVNNTTDSGTGTGAVTVATGAKLGGTGTLTPTGSNGISVTGTLAPGAAAGEVGTLKIDLGSTTGALTLQTGAALSFDIGATSDKISLLGYGGATDFVRNTNVITINGLTGAAAGTYTLFDFYSDSGTTATASGIIDGFTLSTLPSGWSGSLVYNTNSIDFSLTAVPEPSTWIGGGLILGLAGWSQRKRLGFVKGANV